MEPVSEINRSEILPQLILHRGEAKNHTEKDLKKRNLTSQLNYQALIKPSAYLKLKISDLPFKRVTQISPPLSTETTVKKCIYFRWFP